MNKDIKNITVLGAGTMGHGIAHVFSRFGYQVNLYEPFDQVRESAMDKIKAELSFMVEEEYITADEMEKAMQEIPGRKRRPGNAQDLLQPGTGAAV